MKEFEVHLVVAYFAGMFNREVAEEFVNVWIGKVGDLKVQETIDAIDRLALHGYPPNVAQIRADVLIHRANMPTFGQAWVEMSVAASVGDPLEPPKFSHPAVDELARQLGWESFRLSSPTDTYYEHSARQRYEEICERMVARGVSGAPEVGGIGRDALPSGVNELVEGIGSE